MNSSMENFFQEKMISAVCVGQSGLILIWSPKMSTIGLLAQQTGRGFGSAFSVGYVTVAEVSL